MKYITRMTNRAENRRKGHLTSLRAGREPAQTRVARERQPRRSALGRKKEERKNERSMPRGAFRTRSPQLHGRSKGSASVREVA